MGLRSVPALFGRRSELDALGRAVASGAPLVAVVGPPGVGKSVLVSAWAAGVTEGRVALVEVSGVDRPERLAEAVLAALGDVALGADHVEAALAATGQLVLVLDGLDLLQRHAGAQLVGWLGAAPELQVVATTRARLGVSEAVEIEVGPLSPDAAVEMLAAARDAPRAELAAIAEALDGLPLALEIAAGALRLMPTAEVLRRAGRPLSALPSGRADDLRAAVHASWALLDDAGRRSLAVLSLFRGPHTATAAEALLQSAQAADRVRSPIDTIADLAARSLLHADSGPGGPWLRLLAPIRELARQALADDAAAGADALSLAHARVVAADPAAVDWRADGPVAVSRLLAAGDAAVAFGLALGLAQRFLEQGPLSVGETMLDEVCAALGDDRDRASALRRLGADSRLRRNAAAECLAVLDEDPPLWGADAALLRVGAHLRRGDLDAAQAAVDVVLADSEASPRACALAWSDRGAILLEGRRLDEAEVSLDRAWRALAAVGERHGVAVARLRLARIAAERRAWGVGLAQAEAAREAFLSFGDRAWTALADWHRGAMLAQLGRDEDAQTAARAAEHGFRGLGDGAGVARAQGLLGVLALVAGRLDEALACFVEAGSFVEDPRRPRNRVALLQAWALLDLRRGQPERGRLRLDEADALARGAAAEELVAGVAAVRAVLDGRMPSAGDAAPAPLHMRLLQAVLAGTSATSERAAGPRAESDRVLVGPSARWFARNGGPRVDLARRAALRRILDALVAARLADRSDAAGMDVHALAAMGWPGERLHPEVARTRVYTAVRTLRRMGLEQVLVTRDAGYLLDDQVQVDRGS